MKYSEHSDKNTYKSFLPLSQEKLFIVVASFILNWKMYKILTVFYNEKHCDSDKSPVAAVVVEWQRVLGVDLQHSCCQRPLLHLSLYPFSVVAFLLAWGSILAIQKHNFMEQRPEEDTGNNTKAQLVGLLAAINWNGCRWKVSLKNYAYILGKVLEVNLKCRYFVTMG